MSCLNTPQKSFLLLLLLLPIHSSRIRLRKCCKPGETLVTESSCEPNSDKNSSYWIPEKSFIIQSSQSVVKISNQVVSKTIKNIYKSKFEVGLPQCEAASRDSAIVWQNEESEDEFNLLYDNKNVLLNIFRRSVYHDSLTASFRRSFLPDSFCVDSGPANTHLAVVCPCTETTCIRKCCHENDVFDEDEMQCVGVYSLYDNNNGTFDIDNYTDWRPVFENTDLEEDWEESENEYFLLTGKLPPCIDERGVYTEHEDEGKNFYYTADGTLKVNSTSVKTLPAGEHCGDWGWKKSRGRLEHMVMRCFSKAINQEVVRAKVKLFYYAALLVLSALLLVASAVVLFLELNPDVEGKRGARPILGHVSCLALAHLVAAVSYTISISVSTIPCLISVVVSIVVQLNYFE